MDNETYSEKCECWCNCKLYCRPIDNNLCAFCQKEKHAVHEHYFDVDNGFNCHFCDMPNYMESSFPKCHKITEAELEKL